MSKNIIKKEIESLNPFPKKDEKHPTYQGKRTFGQKAADALTKYAGSWVFIIFFFIFIGLWMAANVYMWVEQWDLYPFILLNLVLSCLAAIQAPIILMSQNRAAQRDRQTAAYDYAVNRKAEREILEIKKTVDAIQRKLNKK
ncbi:MAG: DUF1003 domain-containing protein [Nanoarchaeota archaeon]|nr:DUF1003 domain-containing protein [Nanoarchaeota archaeon]